MPNYAESYLGKLRKLIGREKVIITTARAVIVNEGGHVLLVQRSDNKQWVMPAGSMELGESIMETCKREVFEETGLIVESAVLMAIYSDPRYSIVTAYGDPYQIVSFVFRVDRWSGTLLRETDETVDAKFFPLDELPADVPAMYHETLEDLRHFAGTVIIK